MSESPAAAPRAYRRAAMCSSASPERDRQALGYARVTLPLGKKPKRIDCSRIYELEISRLREEIALLKMNAQ